MASTAASRRLASSPRTITTTRRRVAFPFPFPVPVPCSRSLPFYAYLLLPLCRRRRRLRLPVEAGDPAAALFDVEVVVLVSVAGGDDVEVAVEAVLAAPGVADWRRKRTGE